MRKKKLKKKKMKTKSYDEGVWNKKNIYIINLNKIEIKINNGEFS